jgi:predicted porin
MKPTRSGLLGIALFSALPTCAFAQSVTLYGVLDTGAEYVNHIGPQSRSVVRMTAITGKLPSRWGLRGTEAIGNGISVEFALENGFNVDRGDVNQGSRLFGRQAWVGINSPYGSLSFGRQYTMDYWALLDDILGPNIYGLGSLDSYTPNVRSDNTVAYKGAFHGITVGATYSFGRDAGATANSPGQGTCAGQVAGSPTACRQITALLRYDTSSFGIATAYDEQRGGSTAAANFFDGVASVPLTNSGDRDSRIYANGWLKLYGVKLEGGFIGRSVTFASPAQASVRSDLYYLGASYLITPRFAVDTEVFRIINEQHDTRASMVVARGTYLLSKRSAVYLQGAYLWNSRRAAYSISAGGGGTTPAPGFNQLGAMAGIRHLF